MFAVTPYTFQPLFHRFHVLWRYVQVVSDCFTFVLVIICCKCSQAMPVSMTSSCAEIIDATSSKDLEIPKVNYTKSSGEPVKTEHVAIDLDYKGEINEKMKPKSFLSGAPDNERRTEGNLTLENVSVDSNKEMGKNWKNQDIPTIHTKKKTEG
ncbi:uncharacterized protein [Epargyreus clarus]|uniref:uncharacterized protein n=1 Tax=Epargyreus clarus TaxID=520877 RepID=UPI003C2AD43E